ncbi:hypothetical protein [Macrococcus equipercicus]|uniref:DUF4365 domain-containing protein n=1 Tax=Macrococcus equipercicus TaxID=69967 RepID=A0A9Q9BX54_9STAP|nr:hypothetical protein [Macrococcus equipercicus]UTH14197.1 hypothetical protein KFV11_02195 [Macrococcus equipercicus]
MKIDAKRIEKKAINILEGVIGELSNLDYNFNYGDKDISFDGNIDVYNTDKLSKKNYIKSIKVQIKGRKYSKLNKVIKYPVDVKDLNVFLKENGAVYFVVGQIYNSEKRCVESKIYMRHLLPLTINKILHNKEKQKTISISFYEINLEEFYGECIKFIEHQSIQVIRMNSSLIQHGSKNLIVGTSESIKIDENGLPQNDFYLYKKDPLDINPTLPITALSITKLESGNYTTVRLNGEYLRIFVRIEKTKEYQKIIFNQSLEITHIYKKDIQKLKFHSLLDINKYIEAIKIYKAIVNNEIIESELFKIELIDSFEEIEVINKINDHLNELDTILSEMQIDSRYLNGVSNPIDDMKIISLFIESYKNNNFEYYGLNKSNIYQLPLGNTNLAVFYDNDKKEVFNIFSLRFIESWCAIKPKETSKPTIKIPFIFSLNRDFFLNTINFNIDRIIEGIRKLDNYECKDLFEVFNNFSLELIYCYDKTKNRNFLDAAQELINNIITRTSNEKNILIVNMAQIEYRLFDGISEETREKLMQTKISFVQEEHFIGSICVNILLGNEEETEFYLKKLDEEELTNLKKYPIFNLK